MTTDPPAHSGRRQAASPGRYPALRAPLSAGLAAGIVVILVSLPLRSPHDSLMNAGTIAIASVLATAVLAAIWRYLDTNPGRTWVFALVCAAAIAASAAGAFAVETAAGLERTSGFVVPLAALQFGVTAVITPFAARFGTVVAWTIVPLLIAVIALGAGLAANGDQESGRLSLPPRSG